MNKNYILLAHKNPDQLMKLISALDDGDSMFFVHLDAKVDEAEFHILKEKKGVIFIEDRIHCAWGDISLVDATIVAMRKVIQSGFAGRTTLLSGQDYPMKSTEEINLFFKNNQNFEFIDCHPAEKLWSMTDLRLDGYRLNFSSGRGGHLDVRPFNLTDINLIGNARTLYRLLRFIFQEAIFQPTKFRAVKFYFKRRNRYPVQFYGGSQWFSLTFDTVKKIDDFLVKNPRYREYHKDTHCADEIFFQTIIKEIERSGETVAVRGSVTHTAWGDDWCHPRTFDESDVENLMDLPAEKLFARKFDEELHPGVLGMIELRKTNRK
jgi:hypothetical protein